MAQRKRRVRDDSNKTAGYFIRRSMRKSVIGRSILAVVDTPKKVKRTVRKLKRGFAAMRPAKPREIASQGGKAAARRR